MNLCNSLLYTRITLAIAIFAACTPDTTTPEIADNIYGLLGDPLPSASASQLRTFERGRELALRRFRTDEGLGPLVNVTFCAACHEKPAPGGAAPRYRDFYLGATQLADGTYLAGPHGSVITAYGVGESTEYRPRLADDTNLIARRSPIPFFGAGLIAELPEEAILANEDPDDVDADGISGRANYDRGFVGRFGRKAQTVSIEGFIRGPLNNHLGITSDPLTDDQKQQLPVPSLRASDFRQAAAPEEPLIDDDQTPDPELASNELFDLVSFSMLLAAPLPEPPTKMSLAGESIFTEIGCADCHIAGLAGPRGQIPLYSDLLLHDMGPALADGIEQGLADGSEFRTQPLWGISCVGPYLHDGRADTLFAATLFHDGEALPSRQRFEQLSEADQNAVIEFLESLGGRTQMSDGLLPADAPVPDDGEPGAPTIVGRMDLARWLAGRSLFDRNATIDQGLGPVFNGDSCRACHFDPAIGGSGPLDVNVMRHGTVAEDGLESFIAPSYGTILHKLSVPGLLRREPATSINVFEPRQTPSILGLGLVDSIDEQDIIAQQDPEDADNDGISGVVQVLPDGRVGRFGWKAQVPSLREFVRDALSAEVGLTVPQEPDFVFGQLQDDDAAADPEVSTAEIDELTFFMSNLAPPRSTDTQHPGRDLFVDVGCAKCHTPELPGASGPVPLYSDLLLHDVASARNAGIPDGVAQASEFRTPPLWGIKHTAPYMHDGSSANLHSAIEAHDGESRSARMAYDALSQQDRDTLLAFVGRL